MADWLDKLLSIGQAVLNKSVSNPLRLDRGFIESVFKFVEPVGEVDNGLLLGLMKYIIDGSDEEVLLKLSGSPEGCAKLGYGGNTYWNQAKLAEMVKADWDVPAEVWVRVGQVLATATRCGLSPRQPLSAPGYPEWLCAFIHEIVRIHAQNWHGAQKRRLFSMQLLSKMLVSAGLPEDALVRPLLDVEMREFFARGMFFYGGRQITDCFADLDKYFKQHAQVVASFLQQANAEQRVNALEILTKLKVDVTAYLNVIVEIGTSSSKTARDASFALLSQHRESVRPQLEQMLAKSGSSERHEAVVTLWRLCGSDCADILTKHLSQEKSDRIKQTIEKFLASQEASSEMPAEPVTMEPIALEFGTSALSSEFKNQLRNFLKQGAEKSYKDYEKALQQHKQIPPWLREPLKVEAVTGKYFDEVVAFVETGSKLPNINIQEIRRIVWAAGTQFGDWVHPSTINLVQFMRLLYALRYIHIQEFGVEKQLVNLHQAVLDAYRSKCNPPFGLREMDAVVASLPGGEPGLVARGYLSSNSRWNSFCDWDSQAVWPLFAEYPEYIRKSLLSIPAKYDWAAASRRETSFKVLAMFPHVPKEYLALLWDIALGEAKSDRALAQAALHTVPDKASKILVALQDGRQSVRAAAAEWLGKLGEKNSIASLKKAFAKEKTESVKAALMQALETLGADVDEFLDTAKLSTEAKAGLAKKLPKGMEWVALDNLPALHWKDNGSLVDPEIVKWWLVQGIQQKTPAGNPLVKRYLSMCKPTEATALARFVLASWIGRDTAHMSAEDAAERAKQETDKMWNAYSQNKWFIEAYGTKEKLYQTHFSNYMNQCLYSAIDQKGMLALVSAAGDGECVKVCDQYIRKWYGNRLAQCKSLIDVLASIDNPLALQSLLAFANRFRTKAIKQAAEEHVQAIAERQGWTIDELADRTIPTAGFERPVDENGEPIGHVAVLELDYGPRQFEVTLDDNLEPMIKVKGEDKPIKSLPEPGKNDDTELAKAAKKQFSDGKKGVKEIVKRQQERLYEALCTQRQWRFRDWQTYLAQHPVVGRLCVRLVWAAVAPQSDGRQAKLLATFRPMEDGSLTDEADEEVVLPDAAQVVLAHSCNTSSDISKAWQKHFKDYDVQPLFQQFGREPYTLPADQQNAAEIKQFEGHVLTTFKMRGRATKLGYIRGEAEDGGWFYVYRKPFSSLGIQAVIEFTGNYLPEEDRPCALKNLHFTPIPNKEQSQWTMTNMPLMKVPPVLLSECYNDMKQLAAEGTGFDPDWQKKCEY